MHVHVYRTRESFALDHPAALDRADGLAAQESENCLWSFDHAIFDRKLRQTIVAYHCRCPFKPEPCILTILVESSHGQYCISVYQKFE